MATSKLPYACHVKSTSFEMKDLSAALLLVLWGEQRCRQALRLLLGLEEPSPQELGWWKGPWNGAHFQGVPRNDGCEVTGKWWGLHPAPVERAILLGLLGPAEQKWNIFLPLFKMGVPWVFFPQIIMFFSQLNFPFTSEVSALPVVAQGSLTKAQHWEVKMWFSELVGSPDISPKEMEAQGWHLQIPLLRWVLI